MSSRCGDFARQTVALARTQREFWLAWKDVQAGERMPLNTAREAKRSLEEAHFEMTRLIDDAMNPERLARMELKRDYELAARFQRPEFRKNKWVGLSQGRFMEYNTHQLGQDDHRLVVYAPQPDGRYKPIRRIQESQDISYIRAVGNDLYYVMYEGGRSSVLHMDSQGHVLCRYVIDHRPAIWIRGVRQFSDGRLCLIWENGYIVLRQQDDAFVLDASERHRFGNNQPAMYFDDTIVSTRLTANRKMNVLIERPDRDGNIVPLADIHIGPLGEYTYSPDGRLIVLNGGRRSFLFYGDDGDGTYALQGESPVEWPNETNHLGRLTMLSFDRVLFTTTRSAEVWRIRPGARAVRETRVSLIGQEASILLLPDGRLISYNETHDTPSRDPQQYTMRLWTLDEHGRYQVEQEIPQEDSYSDVTPMPDGRILVHCESLRNSSLVYDGEPAA